MQLGRLNKGEWLAGISAFLLFVFMFFHWFGVKLTNTSNLLFAVQGGGPGKDAWEALGYIPIILVITIIVTFVMVALRLAYAFSKRRVQINALVAILGLASMVLILLRIIDPPVFYVEATITSEGTARLPIFLALLTATGVALGGFLAMWEGGFSPSELRAGRQ